MSLSESKGFSLDAQFYRDRGYTEAESQAQAAAVKQSADALTAALVGSILTGGLAIGQFINAYNTSMIGLGSSTERVRQQEMKRANKQAHDAGQGYVYSPDEVNALDNKVTKRVRSDPWAFQGKMFYDSTSDYNKQLRSEGKQKNSTVSFGGGKYSFRIVDPAHQYAKQKKGDMNYWGWY